MLYLQRASAGSGKTYALARHYIWDLLTYKTEEGEYRLAEKSGIIDNLNRILAITFTNKATAEMKERIIDKLSGLAMAAEPTADITDLLKTTDYLADFTHRLKVDPQSIGQRAADALDVVLNHFSDFNISTIDSFFQSILRTFAYEANLNDNFQVEIDSEYVNSTAIDSTLHDLDLKSKQNGYVRFWITEIMNRYSKGWNVFDRKNKDNSAYKDLIDSFKMLDKESFKIIKQNLDSYFSKPDADKTFFKACIDLDELAEKELENKFKKVQKKAACLKKMIDKAFSDNLSQYVYKAAWESITFLSILSNYDNPTKPKPKVIFNFSNYRTILKKGNKEIPDRDSIDSVAENLFNLVDDWNNPKSNIYWPLRQIFAPLFPYVGLMGTILSNLSQYLENNNLLKLADTNVILKKIIGDDEAPFIFERLGSRLHHFLIDEFQDTSKLQWEVILPLIKETVAIGKDNLIIGDAKQSIYRFRNADPSLITSQVAKDIEKSSLIELGSSEKDNTNRRSDKRIVEFNNYIFKKLSENAGKLADKNGMGIDFNDLYSNVVQKPNNEKGGYVEINFTDSAADLKESEEDSLNPEDPTYIETCRIIKSLLSRGYQQKDIAIMIDKHTQGKNLIEAFVKYNSSISDSSKPIEFISEESLYISSSEAVEIIIGVLKKLADGNPRPEGITEEESHKPQPVKWDKIKDNFKLFSLYHPGLSITEQLDLFFKDATEDKTISEMLSNMQAIVLPAIVEATVNTFIPASLRKSQAPFIAAFQDLVTDYCERYPADPASFLEFWKMKGASTSINFPEDVNAVRIMTIHKSKGLEFKCVILPFISKFLVPMHFNHPEWHWIKTPLKCLEIGFPSYMPLLTRKNLIGTSYEDIYKTYYSQFLMDKINKAYVAFTRAQKELYIITSRPKEYNKKREETAETKFNTLLFSLCRPGDLPETNPYVADPKNFKLSEDGNTVTYGEKERIIYHKSENESKKTDETGSPRQPNRQDVKPKESDILESYESPGTLSLLQCVSASDPIIIDPDEDPDPRSEGNLLHAAMEKIRTPKDIRYALLSLKTKGFITTLQMNQWMELLKEALSQPLPSDWFADNWKVMNERSLWENGRDIQRADRIIIDEEKKECIVIDFKFGTNVELSKYLTQIRNYMRRLSEALKDYKVSGYIWFPKTGLIIDDKGCYTCPKINPG